MLRVDVIGTTTITIKLYRTKYLNEHIIITPVGCFNENREIIT